VGHHIKTRGGRQMGFTARVFHLYMSQLHVFHLYIFQLYIFTCTLTPRRTNSMFRANSGARRNRFAIRRG